MSFASLENKKILITGASSGIGAQAARSFHKAGASIIVSARNLEKLNELKNELGSDVDVIAADLLVENELNALVDNCSNLDGVFFCTGLVSPYPVHFIQQKSFDKVFKTNFNASAFLCARLFKKKKINEGSSLVFMSSISSDFAHKGGALYASAKAAINALSKSISIEYAHKGIRSNVIKAAMVKTAIFDQAEAAVTKEKMALHEKDYPLGFGETTDVCNAARFLLSDDSKWITGTDLVMDGGLSAGH